MLYQLMKETETADESAIIFDEMSLRSQTLLDEKTGKIVGHVDYGSIQGEPKENTANHVLVVMVTGLKRN